MPVTEAQNNACSARVFFALWPTITVRQALHGLASEYELPCAARVMSADRLHLTLLFVGKIERARLPLLIQAADRVSAALFWLVIERLAFWQHNKIAYATLRRAALPLARLVAALESAVQATDFSFAGGEFHPHITLLRNVQHVLEPQSIPPVRWWVDSFVLLESVMDGQEMRYQILAQWPLVEMNVGV